MAKTLEELKESGVELFEYDLIGTPVTFRLPKQIEGDAYLGKHRATNKAGESVYIGQASRVLVTQCTVHPEPGILQALIDKRPGACIMFANEIFQLYCGEAEDKAKKL